MTEAKMLTDIKKRFSDVRRIENSMNAGLPDVLIFSLGLTIFMELKVRREFSSHQIHFFSGRSAENLVFVYVYNDGVFHVGREFPTTYALKVRGSKEEAYVNMQLVGGGLTDFYKYLNNIKPVAIGV